MTTTDRNKRSIARSGFTLIELVVVIVILGILAAVALPRIVQNVDKARAAEVFNFGGTAVKAFQRCVDEISVGQDTNALLLSDPAAFDNCKTWAGLGISTPPANKFQYVIGGQACSLIVAADLLPTGQNNVIDMRYSACSGSGSGVTFLQCSGIFSKLCN